MNYCKLVTASIALTGLVSLPLVSQAESLAGSRSEIPVQEWPINYSLSEIKAILLATMPATAAGSDARYQREKMANKDRHETEQMKKKSLQRAYEYKRQTFDQY